MGIHYDFSTVQDAETVCFVERDGKKHLHPVTDALMYLLGFNTGIAQITEENVDEVYRRIHIFEHAFDPYLIQKNEKGDVLPRYITYAEVKAHIGYKVNASPMTKREFHAHIMKLLKRDAELALSRAKEA